ncbi:MAG: hypothetical protein HOQ22_14795 [Nocardioidaceae bacterium]|nr:hypothetical protein [Nocardioidaceae bacterium]
MPTLLVRAIAAAVLLGTALTPAPADAAPVVSPGRALFNDPLGDEDAQYALVRHIDGRIDHARPGATVRLAAYSFAMPSTARALLRAFHRGVFVKVVVDQRSRDWGSVQRLRRTLGSDTDRRSFVRVCRESCRGSAGRQHAKFVTISRTDGARRVVLVGSMNFTAFAARRQWQDLYAASGDDRLFLQLRTLFRGMVRDTPQPPLHLPPAGHGFQLSTAPDARYDALRARLDRVRCRGTAAGTGVHGRSRISISMHAWNGPRGVALAHRVALLRRHGCVVRVLAGVGFGRRVTHVLRTAGVAYRDTTRAGPATHQKLMVLSGILGRDRAASYVWPGSHNWSNQSLRHDEVVLRVAGPRTVAAYERNVGRIWRLTGRKPG